MAEELQDSNLDVGGSPDAVQTCTNVCWEPNDYMELGHSGRLAAVAHPVANCGVRSTTAFKSGVHYAEIELNLSSQGGYFIGMVSERFKGLQHDFAEKTVAGVAERRACGKPAAWWRSRG